MDRTRRQEHERWLKELTSIPTAAGREDRVIRWIEAWVSEREDDLALERDDCGNLLIRQRRGGGDARPIFITAHLDHPAFVTTAANEGDQITLEFRGGVHDPYFVGTDIEIVDDNDRSHRATITALDHEGKPFKTVIARLHEATDGRTLDAGLVGRWLLPSPSIRNGRLYTHACDDLAAVAAALAAIDRLREVDGLGHVGLLFTRAEEIGFVGAIGACKCRSAPENSRLICLENSRSFRESPIGGGPILRVGDRISVFDPRLTNRLGDILTEHAREHEDFTWQRKLMPGGACEATTFSTYGYESTCVCLPLGNYHNMADIDGTLKGKPARIAREVISLDDYHGLIELLVVGCTQLDTANVPDMRERMEERWTKHRHLVQST